MGRHRHIVRLLVAINATILLAGSSFGCSGGGDGDAVSGPKPPKKGAWLGAAVMPRKFTPHGRTSAYRHFEDVTGRELDVVHTYHKWRDPFPDQVDEHFLDRGQQLVTGWAASDAPGIADGDYDELIEQRAEDVKDLDDQIMLAPRWEMDRPNLRDKVGSSKEFVSAWKRIRKIFDEAGADNVGWVWAPTAEGFTKGYAQDFYPGDDQVDWIAVDAYTGSTVRPFADVMAAFMRFANAHDGKPLMIAEFALSHRGGQRPEWLDAARRYVKDNPRIKAALYFDGNMSDGPTRQFALHGSSSGRKAFNAWLADPYFNTKDREVTEPR